ncbi:MAG TPA: inorganic phosphate transporter [Candidatus Avibacteroides excrementipullorum]|nr:inorganic phosphate transporter [Candidatus Avibacteroides excrementipullorum]
METIYLFIVGFLFLLAIFDLTVGVANDAVNFVNSAVGSRAAKFKVILMVASLGVLAGAIMSNGMMDIARHGIFHPSYFSFFELMCIFLAVMCTDVILLDVFNTLGLPTSTTVSLVFELLGGTIVLAAIKLLGDSAGIYDFGMLVNTSKALQVILAIFLSVAIAFVVGTTVQYLARMIFSFNYVKKLKYTIGIFGGIACTAMVYFILIKGVGKSSLVSPEMMQWIDVNTWPIVGASFVLFTVLMQLLHAVGVNVFKIIILLGTFALALAFAGNDLVNFIGVPLAGYSSYLDYVANNNGQSVYDFMMHSLNSSAKTPFIFLFAAGLVMVWTLWTSKKAHNVINTEVNLGRQDAGDERFGSSLIGRLIVRRASSINDFLKQRIPANVRKWIDTRFNKDEIILENGAAFDLVRASVNLVVSGLLIVIGTNMQLPLSTTYVTFIVAMGSSLADRAWGRESAVYRITGVLSVIGGWFVTAFVAFTVCAIVTLIMFYLNVPAMLAFIVLAVVLLIRSNLKYKKKISEEKKATIYQEILNTKDKDEVWTLLRKYYAELQAKNIAETGKEYKEMLDAFFNNNLKELRKAQKEIVNHRNAFDLDRHRQLVGVRKLKAETAIEYNTWFHLGVNSDKQMIYCLRRMADPCKNHVDNNFNPMPKEYIDEFRPLYENICKSFEEASSIVETGAYDRMDELQKQVRAYKKELSTMRKAQFERLHDNNGSMKVDLIYLNIMQESQEMLSCLKHSLRANFKFQH